MNPKYIIPLCLGLFVIAFAIKCSNDGSKVTDDKLPKSVPIQHKKQDDTDNKERKKVTNIGDCEDIVVDVDFTGIEIPKLISDKSDQILARVGYTTSYNKDTKNANWVAWHLTAEHTDGPWCRDGIPYLVDEDVKGPRQESFDWNDVPVGYNHGHMCPAGDNKWDENAMLQSFLLTNMCAQNSQLNNGDWKKLEDRCRGWARHYGDVYIVCGPIFYSEDYKTFGDNKVGIPDAFYKVILCMKKKPKALGFIYPNNGIHHKIDEYVVTVDEVEKKTGIDFFYNLPDDIENEVEAVSNFKSW